MEVIAPHLKTIRTIAFLAVAVVAIEAALPWSPLGPIIPHLLGRLSAPTGFPSDTQTSWNHLDGTAWWYCRNTPSGHVRIGVQDESPEPFFRLQSGMGCARTRDGDPPLAPSLTTPAFVVGRSKVVSFAVPKPPGGWGHNTPCEFTLSAPYLHMARRHLAELMSLDDPIVRKSHVRLEAAASTLASFSVENLRGTFFDGDGYFCMLWPARPKF